MTDLYYSLLARLLIVLGKRLAAHYRRKGLRELNAQDSRTV